MIYRPANSRYYFVRWKFRGKLIRRSTRETSRKAARAAELRMRTEFNAEQSEIDKAAALFGCDSSLLTRCPECTKLFRADRAVIAGDGQRLCHERCRKVWSERCNPVPVLQHFLTRDFLPFAKARSATKEKTLTYYRYGVARLLSDSDLASLRLDEVTSQHVTQFAARLSPLSPSTINCALRTLRHALNLAEEWGKLTRAPKIPLAKGEHQRERVLTDAEFMAYIEACSQPWRDLVLLIRFEGMRPGEAYPLRWENVLLNGHGRLILISGGKSKAARRKLPITPEVYAALKARHLEQGEPESGWIFPSDSASGHVEQGSAKNQHLKALRTLQTATDAYEHWKKSGGQGDWTRSVATRVQLQPSFVDRHADTIKAGLKAFEPYCLRHTALTRLGEAGCDAFTLAKIAGHSSITITQRYVHPQADAIERAFAKLENGAAPMLPASVTDRVTES
jgi:integrase